MTPRRIAVALAVFTAGAAFAVTAPPATASFTVTAPTTHRYGAINAAGQGSVVTTLDTSHGQVVTPNTPRALSAASSYGASPASGDHRVLVIRVNGTTTVDPATTMAAVDAWYNEVSYGQARFTQVTVVPTPVTVTPAASGCSPHGSSTADDFTALDNYHRKAQLAAAAIDPVAYNPANFNEIIVTSPDIDNCNWIGLAEISGKQVWVAGSWFTLQTVAHELGHTLGLDHANTADCTDTQGLPATFGPQCGLLEYGDPFDAMGQGTKGSGHFSAPEKQRLGWMTTRLVTVTQSAELDLSPLEAPSATTPQAAQVNDLSGDHFWLEYRTPIGVDNFISPSVPNGLKGSGVQIRFAPSGPTKLPIDGFLLLDGTATSAAASRSTGGDFADAALVVGVTYHLDTAAITVTSTTPTTAHVSIVISDPAGTLTTFTPKRVLDTRTEPTRVSTGAVRVVDLSAITGGANSTQAAVINLTVTDPTGSGYLTAYPCSSTRPDTSNLNFVAGQVIANAATVAVTNNQICLYAFVSPGIDPGPPTVNIVVDVTGAFSSPTGIAGSRFVSLDTPQRLIDTRGSAKVSGTLVVPLTGRFGIGTAAAAQLNVTATETTGSGYLTVYPCGAIPPTSTLDFVAGQFISNAATVGLDGTGAVCVFSSVPAHVIVDVSGWFGATGAVQFTVPPSRLIDTRTSGTTVAAHQQLVVTAAGQHGVPTDATSVMTNITSTRSTGDGYLTAYPCAGDPTASSTVNHRAGANAANATVTGLSASGQICIYSYATSDIVVDVAGYYR
jgi:hypothetical protein